ncbi:SPOR domain-containing protein [Bacteroides heparinolyticus]|uniref:SPOR domain-containing protein n=1 Tax=Prevotella heparinolytica TaxID=28113 RepID=UPI00359F982A
MKKSGLLLIVCFVFATFSIAQNNIVKSLERDVPGQGKVTIHQDARIAALIGMEAVPTVSTDEQRMIKSSGYRIQVYAGNNTRQAKNEAYAVAARIKEYFPDLTVYTFFNPPRWLCRAGDYRSIEEADAMMRRLRATGVFKEVSIVREQINIPL